MPSVYILSCSDGSYYIGSAQDAKKRHKDHLRGKCKYTKSRLPINIVCTENYSLLQEARKGEKQIKNGRVEK